jgi:hypothetical protein
MAFVRDLVLLLLVTSVAGCAVPSNVVKRELQVTVIYADHARINEEATKRGHMWEVFGFYDPVRKEIWCPNDETSAALQTCGHELRHAVLGPFHGGDQLTFLNATSPLRRR